MSTTSALPIARAAHPLEKRFQSLAKFLDAGTAFELQLPERPPVRMGSGDLLFRIAVADDRGVAALSSFDEIRIGEAYLEGHWDIEGDLVAALHLRKALSDHHPLVKWWSKSGQKLVFGQAKCDQKWISEHYDSPPEFYTLFLDKQARCYSHGYFANDEEPLEAAIQRKLATAFDAVGIQPGWRVLDIGAGWGAFTQYAGSRGAHVTSLTISKESETYVSELIASESLTNCEVRLEHFLEYRNPEPFDAIVNLGVTEHLPDYRATLRQYDRLLKPGRRVFLDACSSEIKYPFGTFVQKYVWPGNATPLVVREYLDEVARTPLEVLSIINDRRNYMLTCRHWAENLDTHKSEVIARWGDHLYRRFRLYLWGCVHEFVTNSTSAHRLLLQKSARSEPSDWRL